MMHVTATKALRFVVVVGLGAGAASLHPAGMISTTGASRAAQAGVTLKVVGQFGGAVSAVAADGPYAYVAMGPRLVVFDVSEPGQPREVGRTEPLPWLLQGVTVANGYAYTGRV